MRITTRDPVDGSKHTRVVALPEAGTPVAGGDADAQAPYLPDAFDAYRRLTRCCACGCDELFVRKDFPQRIGLWMVIVAGVASVVLFGMRRVMLALAVLAALVLVDVVLMLVVGRCVVCYRCRAEYRDISIDPATGPWDLATGEKYRAGDDATPES